MKLFLLLCLSPLSLLGIVPENSDKYIDDFSSVFQKSMPPPPAAQTTPNFPPKKRPKYRQDPRPEIFPIPRKGTQRPPSGLILGPQVTPPPPSQQPVDGTPPSEPPPPPTSIPQVQVEEAIPSNVVVQPPRPPQGKPPHPPPLYKPMELQHHGELMTHPKPQQNPTNESVVFPPLPRKTPRNRSSLNP